VHVVVDDFVKRQHTLYISNDESRALESHKDVVDSADTRGTLATDKTDLNISGASSKASFSFVASSDIHMRSSDHVDVTVSVEKRTDDHHRYSAEAEHFKKEVSKQIAHHEVTEVTHKGHVETPKRKKSVKDHYSKSMGGSTPIVKSEVSQAEIKEAKNDSCCTIF
jgi:hypothetical protein